jgi:hypothetical protein
MALPYYYTSITQSMDLPYYYTLIQQSLWICHTITRRQHTVYGLAILLHVDTTKSMDLPYDKTKSTDLTTNSVTSFKVQPALTDNYNTRQSAANPPKHKRFYLLKRARIPFRARIYYLNVTSQHFMA